jgi:hypothetical protein
MTDSMEEFTRELIKGNGQPVQIVIKIRLLSLRIVQNAMNSIAADYHENKTNEIYLEKPNYIFFYFLRV